MSDVEFAFDDDDSVPISLEELRDAAPRCTDSANADAVVDEHGKGYLFVVEWESWIAWDGRRWDRTGARGRVLNASLLTARAEHYRAKERFLEAEKKIRKAAMAMQKDEDAEAEAAHEKRLLKWHEQSQNAGKLEACVKILETKLTVSLKELDRNPWLLNVRNGTVDLRTAELRGHDPTDRITQLSDIEWDPDAMCPTWETFVRSAMGDDLLLTLYLQRLVGYAMTALTTEHVLAFFYGGGRNGKSTFVQAIRSMLGEYACAAPRDLLFEDRAGQRRHPAELAMLYGKRLAVCAEIGEGTTLDEAKVKDLTGGDTVAVRRMREDFWDLEPTHTLFLSGNHKPVIRGNDLGIWRRIRLVPWTVTVSEEQVDKDLPSKLRGELPGILRWAVDGCLEWQRNGLAEPPSVAAATSEYRDESDTLGQFFADHLVFAPDVRVTRQALRVRYEAWCEDNGSKPVGAKKMAGRLKDHGVEGVNVREAGKTRDGWRGVRLKREDEMIVDGTSDGYGPS